MDIEVFVAPVVEAIVDDPKAETGKRDARYIMARDIPAEIIQEMLGYGVENKRHPHNINGMAWDMTVNNWRNMKNAQILESSNREVVCDIAGDERFFLP